MSSFSTYLRLGYEHILSLSALDHILFVIVLMAAYHTKHWLRIVIAVSLFTVGHSLSLILSSYNVVSLDKQLVEFLIPLTIVLTAVYNLTKSGQQAQGNVKYGMALIFGLIHGFGFSSYISMLMMGDGDLWSVMLPFNLGIELGQLVIVLATFVVMLIMLTFMRRKPRDWNFFVSGMAFGLSVVMCIENWPW
ncbi:MAG: HupE / UreJ protein [Owenweeksia sp.]|nr:HupE / UreJ protein [Owenweeksia sp.]MBF99761.1 HupE / UreJ protein [Owenweeksia sp.]HBF18854.1 HupE / UreJ protein [Cryomorphaceae bacterium]HCQ16706.1 HupE / UreJ protein [Cryomorphaceae bacterium]|tara:strand:+ start:180 stop:755 length:576 start_codon:yes stop_codon:yes gene_type:complete